MMIFVTAVNALGRFYRAGLEFTKEGRVLDVAEIGETVFERLKAEANLYVRDATDEETAAHKATASGAGAPADHHDALMDLIRDLPAEAFGQHGPGADMTEGYSGGVVPLAAAAAYRALRAELLGGGQAGV